MMTTDGVHRLRAGSHKQASINAVDELVYRVLDGADGPLARKEIVIETYLSGKQVLRALNRLRDRGAVRRFRSSADARRYCYEIVGDLSVSSVG